jgi:hypothetical protein
MDSGKRPSCEAEPKFFCSSPRENAPAADDPTSRGGPLRKGSVRSQVTAVLRCARAPTSLGATSLGGAIALFRCQPGAIAVRLSRP